MAYDWVDKALSQKSPSQTGRTASVPVTPTPIAPTPVSRPKKPSPTNPHGQYMSGTFVDKAFDVLRTPEYAFASFLKGTRDSADKNAKLVYQGRKSFPRAVAEDLTQGVKSIVPGVSQRRQFSRLEGDYNVARDITKNDKAQAAINFGASLVSPSLPIAKTANIVSKAPGASRITSATQKVTQPIITKARQTPKVYEAIEKIPGAEHFRNPEAGKILKESTDVAAQRISALYNKINDTASKLKPAEREEIGRIIEGISDNTDPRLVTRANYIRQISDQIGQEVVDAGLMSKETFAKMKGKYMARIADVVKDEKKFKATKNMLNFTGDPLKQRKGKLGTEGYPDYIREFQFPTFKSLSNEIQNVESVKAVRRLVEKYGVKVKPRSLTKNFNSPRTTQDGMVYLRDIPSIPSNVAKQFRGMAVPQEVADYLTRKYTSSKPGALMSGVNKATNAWKHGKTIYSGPGYHVRNIMSNQILSDASTNAGISRTLYDYARAVKAYMGKGGKKMNQYMDEAIEAGLIKRVDVSEGVEKMNPKMFMKESKLKRFVKSPIKFQQATEDTSKLNVFAYWREKGLSVRDALKKAEEAIFSPHNISASERGATRNIIPFYSFTRQAVPFVAKTAVNKGNTITKYEKAKTAVESLSPEGVTDLENLPDYRKGQVRLPVKDKDGNYTYFDPTYTIPWGQFDSEAGGQGPFGTGFNPFLTEAASQAFNKDLYFNQPIAKSNIPSRQRAERIQHGYQTFAPNIMPTDFVGGIPSGEPGLEYKTRGGSKLYDAFKGEPDYAGRKRSKTQAVLDTFGLKSSTFRPDEQKRFDNADKRKALQDIQKERRSILRDQRYTPQEKKEYLLQLSERAREILSQ